MYTNTHSVLVTITTLLLFVVLQSCDRQSKDEVETLTIKEVSRDYGEISDSAMVVTAHPLASQIGTDVLRDGGNAFDAAVAVQFALAVVNPRAGNIGGGGFAVLRHADGRSETLDFRETAPSTASRNMFINADGKADSKLSLKGGLASGVPGTVDGMIALYNRHGTLPFERLIDPAIQLAKNGFAISGSEAGRLNHFRAEFIEQNPDRSLSVLKDSGWKEGDTLKFIALANTFESIKNKGRAGFYEGITANLIVDQMKLSKGIITLNDLQSYTSKWREPIICRYKNYRIISMPPPSSGGIAICQILNGIVQFGLDSVQTSRNIHLIAELEKRAFYDRALYLGDSDFHEVPVYKLVNVQYLKDKFSGLSMDSTTAYGDKLNANNVMREKYETTHFSIVDSRRNAISVTTTLNGNYGSKVVVSGAGFFLNNEMDDFSAQPGVPNQFGLVGAEANSIAPGKRMLSSMTPTIIEKDKQLFMVLGGPGGPTIITSVLQTFINVADYGMTAQEAVNTGRFHHQWLPDVLMVESSTLTPQMKDSLTNMGHKTKTVEALGKIEAILVREDNRLEGAADSLRGKDDRAAGI